MAMSRTIPYNNPLFLVFQSRRKPGGDTGHERSGAGAGRRFVSANAKEEWADRKRRQVRESGNRGYSFKYLQTQFQSSSGAGPMYFDVLGTREEKLKFTRPMSRDDLESEISSIESSGDGFEAYAGSKALLACYTMHLAESHGPGGLTVSTITPGFIKTNLTSGMGASKSPDEGTVSIKRCLFDELPGNGYFYGSDGLRSPLHYLRNPGEPEFDGNVNLERRSCSKQMVFAAR